MGNRQIHLQIESRHDTMSNGSEPKGGSCTPTTSASDGRIAWVDTARALAMIWIVGFWHALGGYCPHFWQHLQTMVPFHALSAVTTGVLGSFMFLSSNLICAHRSFSERNDAFSFYRSRAIRILPLYLLSLATFPNVRYNGHGIAVRFFALFGLSQYVPGYGIITLWFISVLLSFYLLLPLIATERISQYRRFAIGLAFLGLFSGLPIIAGSDPRIPGCFAAFLFGSWRARNISEEPLWKTWAWSVGWLSLLLLPDETTLRNILISSLGIAPLRLVAVALSRLPKLDALWRFLAYVSFAAYLFHRQVYKVFVHCLPPEGPFRPVVVVAIGFPVVLAVSFVLQRVGDRCVKRLHRL